MRVNRAPRPVRREAEPDKRGRRGRWYLVSHQGPLLAQLRLVDAGAAGLHEHERADLPGGAIDQNADADTDTDTDQFIGVTGPHAVGRTADAVVFIGRGRPDPDGVGLVADRRPVEWRPVQRRPAVVESA
jgi:hypothetical protein